MQVQLYRKDASKPMALDRYLRFIRLHDVGMGPRWWHSTPTKVQKSVYHVRYEADHASIDCESNLCL